MSESEKRNLKKTISLRVDIDEYNDLNSWAQEREMKVSGIVRHLVFKKRRPESHLPSPPRKQIIGDADVLRKIYAELNKQGKNISDLAKLGNSIKKKKRIDTVPELEVIENIYAEIERMSDALCDALGVD